MAAPKDTGERDFDEQMRSSHHRGHQKRAAQGITVVQLSQKCLCLLVQAVPVGFSID